MPKKLVGRVTSSAADKTIVITVTSRETHPLYGKQYTVTRKYMAHDPKNTAQVGDIVEVSECRPVSKRKSWQLDHVIESGHSEIELKEEAEVVAKKDTDKEAA